MCDLDMLRTDMNECMSKLIGVENNSQTLYEHAERVRNVIRKYSNEYSEVKTSIEIKSGNFDTTIIVEDLSGLNWTDSTKIILNFTVNPMLTK